MKSGVLFTYQVITGTVKAKMSVYTGDNSMQEMTK